MTTSEYAMVLQPATYECPNLGDSNKNVGISNRSDRSDQSDVSDRLGESGNLLDRGNQKDWEAQKIRTIGLGSPRTAPERSQNSPRTVPEQSQKRAVQRTSPTAEGADRDRPPTQPSRAAAAPVAAALATAGAQMCRRDCCAALRVTRRGAAQITASGPGMESWDRELGSRNRLRGGWRIHSIQ
eukprot:gene14613-biopygen1062